MLQRFAQSTTGPQQGRQQQIQLYIGRLPLQTSPCVFDRLVLLIEAAQNDCETKDSSPGDAQRALKQLGFSFESGRATPLLLDKLLLLQEILFDTSPPTVVPMSYLLNADGRLAGIYRGSVGVRTLLGDVAILTADAERRRPPRRVRTPCNCR